MSYSSDWQRFPSLVLRSSSRLAEYETREGLRNLGVPHLYEEDWKRMEKNKRSGGSILQIFIRLRTWNTSPNNVKNSKKYPLLTLTTYFDTTFTTHSFNKSSVTF